MARETKVGLVLILILMGTFGFVVWKKLDKRRQELAVARQSALQGEDSADEADTDGHHHADGDQFAHSEGMHSGDGDSTFAQNEPPQQSFEPAAFDQAAAPAQTEPVDFAQPRQIAEPQRLEDAPFGVAQNEPQQQAPPAQNFQPAADNWSGNGQQSVDEQPFNPGGASASVPQQPAGEEFAQRETARPIQGFDENPFGGEPTTAQAPPQAADQFEPSPSDFERPPGQATSGVAPATADAPIGFDPQSGFEPEGVAQASPAGPAQQTGFQTTPPQQTAGGEFEENPFGGSDPVPGNMTPAGDPSAEFGEASDDARFGEPAGNTAPPQQTAAPVDDFEPVPGQSSVPAGTSSAFDPFDGTSPAKSAGAGNEPVGSPADTAVTEQSSPVPDNSSAFPQDQPFPAETPTQQVRNQVPASDSRYGDYRPVPFDANSRQATGFDPAPKTPLPAAIGDKPFGGTGAGTAGVGNARPRVYEVQSGDNYWRIARSQLGDARYYMALAQYNAQRIPDPKRLKPRMKVLIPTQAELYRRFPKVCPVPEGMAAGGAGAAAKLPGFFVNATGQPMYRIGAEDTLTHIAHRHLGRTSRWTQIYDMNRDKLPSPNTLKIGMELRLPSDASRVRVVGTASADR